MIWAVGSGSGGVGKTTVALSLAVGAAKAGKRVILLDASGAARSADLILGMESVMVLDLADAAGGEIGLPAALYPCPRYDGLSLASASLYEGTRTEELSGAILALGSMCDVLVIDLPTGQADIGKGLMNQEDELILVTRPDDASLRACERLTQRARRESAGISVIVNRARRDFERRGAQLGSSAVGMILDCRVLGVIPEDDSVVLSAKSGRPAIECDGPAWSALSGIARQLLGRA